MLPDPEAAQPHACAPRVGGTDATPSATLARFRELIEVTAPSRHSSPRARLRGRLGERPVTSYTSLRILDAAKISRFRSRELCATRKPCY